MFKTLLEKLKWGFLALCAIFDNGLDELERETRDCYVEITRVNKMYYLSIRCLSTNSTLGEFCLVKNDPYQHRNQVAQAIEDHLMRCYEYQVSNNTMVKDWIGATVRLHKSGTLRFKMSFFSDLVLHIKYNKG